MNVFASDSVPLDRNDSEEQERSAERSMSDTTTPDGGREIKWKVVRKTAGVAPAEIIAQRLLSEGIPARAWQEGAGQAFGLTVGLLGTGYVMVPAANLEEAKAILAEEFDRAAENETLDEDEDYWEG